MDYAPALVGFELQGGRHVPKIEGVVVCEVRMLVLLVLAWGYRVRRPADDEVITCIHAHLQEFQEQVMSKAFEREASRQAAVAARHDREMRYAWLQLLQALHVRQQLGQRAEADQAHADGAAPGAANGGGGGRRGGKKRGAGKGGEEDEARAVRQRQEVMQRLLGGDAPGGEGQQQQQQQQQQQEQQHHGDVEMEEI